MLRSGKHNEPIRVLRKEEALHQAGRPRMDHTIFLCILSIIVTSDLEGREISAP